MGRSIEKNEEQRKETMQKIEDGALYYFAKHGLAGSKISDLSKYLGISQGLLYRYYPSKEELFRTVSKKWIENRDTNFQGLVEAPTSSKEKIFFLTDYIEKSLHRDVKFASFFTIFENDSLTSGTGGGTQFEAWSNEPIQMLARIIEQGQGEGDVHMGNPIQMAISYWGLVFAISHNYISSGSLEGYDIKILNRLLIKNI